MFNATYKGLIVLRDEFTHLYNKHSLTTQNCINIFTRQMVAATNTFKFKSAHTNIPK